MSSEDSEILDYPNRPKKNAREYKLVRILALSAFILALAFRLFQWPGHVSLIIIGAGLFLVWSILRYMALPKKPLSEKLYLPGRILLVSGLTIRYSTFWIYDKYLVYVGLLLFLTGLLISFRESPEN